MCLDPSHCSLALPVPKNELICHRASWGEKEVGEDREEKPPKSA